MAAMLSRYQKMPGSKRMRGINATLILFLSDALGGFNAHNKMELGDAKRLRAGCEMSAGSRSVAQRSASGCPIMAEAPNIAQSQLRATCCTRKIRVQHTARRAACILTKFSAMIMRDTLSHQVSYSPYLQKKNSPSGIGRGVSRLSPLHHSTATWKTVLEAYLGSHEDNQESDQPQPSNHAVELHPVPPALAFGHPAQCAHSPASSIHIQCVLV